MAQVIPSLSKTISRFSAGCVGIALTLAVAGCAKAPVSSEVGDPGEAFNRKVFAFNVGVDKAVLQPISGVAGSGRGPILTGVHNFAANLDTPGDIVNNVLQGRLMRAARNTLRFGVNTTAGIGGLFDPSTALGLPAQETDFGETLYVWGVGEGNYQMLPSVGPSTERDTAGLIDSLRKAAVFDDSTAARLQAAHATLLARGLECTLDRRRRRLPLDDSLEAARMAIRSAAQAQGLVFDA